MITIEPLPRLSTAVHWNRILRQRALRRDDGGRR